ncbi:uncharacterized protein LOC124136737 [Haliotis rufescens]|uniref:uncharacterized protein LOC124136737 n=1 Tax=Haliotis rufescens TaxID=6454 RepID=UPI00201ECED8|nr:uncharacterized protein LOC124136737 [Haliotis rufescens]
MYHHKLVSKQEIFNTFNSIAYIGLTTYWLSVLILVEYVMDTTCLSTSAVGLVGVALIVFLLLRRFHRLIQATLRIELSKFLQPDSRHNDIETTPTSRVKSGGALRTYPLTPGMCTGCLAGGGYIRMDTDNMSDTSHEENVTYNEYGCTSVTV